MAVVQTLGMELPADQFLHRTLFIEGVPVAALGERGRIDIKFDLRTNTVSFFLEFGSAVYRLRRGFVFTMCKPDGTVVLTETSVRGRVDVSGERMKEAFGQGATSVAFRAVNKMVVLPVRANETLALGSAQSG